MKDIIDQIAQAEPDCTKCNGWGWIDGNVSKTCPDCGGSGVKNG